jgi:hypothetical protein
LICEAKNYDGRAGLPVIRNFVGAFKDIAENYFIEKRGDSNDPLLAKRYTDTGAIFSAHGFTPQAQDYAYAQGVFLISYEDNIVLSPLLESSDSILRSINLENAARNTFSFRSWISEKTKNPNTSIDGDDTFGGEGFSQRFTQYVEVLHGIRTSQLGTASGVYPIHLLSQSNIPWQLFETRDEVACQIHYRGETTNCLEISPVDSPTRFYASIPKDLIANYKDRIKMLDFKQRYFSYVDTEWIDSLRQRYRLDDASYMFPSR